MCHRQEATLANLISGYRTVSSTDSIPSIDCGKLKPGLGQRSQNVCCCELRNSVVRSLMLLFILGALSGAAENKVYFPDTNLLVLEQGATW